MIGGKSVIYLFWNVAYIKKLAASPRRHCITVASRLLAIIGAKLVCSHGGPQVGKCRDFGAPIRISVSLSILLLAAKGAKLICPHGSLQVGKLAVHDE